MVLERGPGDGRNSAEWGQILTSAGADCGPFEKSLGLQIIPDSNSNDSLSLFEASRLIGLFILTKLSKAWAVTLSFCIHFAYLPCNGGNHWVRIVSPVMFIKEKSNEKNVSFCDKGGKLCHSIQQSPSPSFSSTRFEYRGLQTFSSIILFKNIFVV